MFQEGANCVQCRHGNALGAAKPASWPCSPARNRKALHAVRGCLRLDRGGAALFASEGGWEVRHTPLSSPLRRKLFWSAAEWAGDQGSLLCWCEPDGKGRSQLIILLWLLAFWFELFGCRSTIGVCARRMAIVVVFEVFFCFHRSSK